MRILLDTHTFLWWFGEPEKLSASAREAIANPSNAVVLSVVSAWEIVIKARSGKLSLPQPPEVYLPERLARGGFQVLSIDMGHVLRLAKLPSLHRDPFDRMSIAQSQTERIPLVTADREIARYEEVQILW